MKARAALLSGLGIRSQTCSVRAALRMYSTLVLPCLDYGVSVWGQGEWPAADQLQAEAAAMILRTLPQTCGAALRGELGWQRLRARRERISVAYWSALLGVNGASPARYRCQIYRAELYETGRDATFSADDSCLSTQTERKAACHPWSDYVHGCLVRHGLQRYWDEQDCVSSSGHYAVDDGDMAAAAESIEERRDNGAATVTTLARRKRNYFTLPLLADWRRASDAEQQKLWRDEMAELPSLDTYRVVKRRLELESYLHDASRMVSVNGRRAAKEFARLRCGVHELAISAERWQRRGGRVERLPRELRVCAWCAEAQRVMPPATQPEEGLAAPDVSHAATAATAPVEDEQHVLLHCPQYARLRAELFADVLAMSSERDDDGRCVLPSGPVRLAEMLGAAGRPGGTASALAIVAGGVWSRLEEKPKRTTQAWRIDAAVRQRCELFVGCLMHCRRRWQRAHQRGRSAARPGERRRRGDSTALDSPGHKQLRLGVSCGAQPQHGLVRNRQPAEWALTRLPADQSDRQAPTRTHHASHAASARKQSSLDPARQAAPKRQASRSRPARASGSKADIPTLTVPRRERSIVTYMQLWPGSAASAAAACAPRAHLVRGP